MAIIRLNKYLAGQGIASRRKSDEYIASGYISVNGVVVKTLGTKIDTAKDNVTVDPKVKVLNRHFAYIVLHKPVGYVTAVTGKEEPKVTKLLKDFKEKVFPVGRLDKATSGLLLFTNDGRFARYMTSPESNVEKEYEVTLVHEVEEMILKKLEKSMVIDGEPTRPTKITILSPTQFRITLTEGKNRQIRKMCRKISHRVEALKRIRIGRLRMNELESGKWQKLTHAELGENFGYKGD